MTHYDSYDSTMTHYDSLFPLVFTGAMNLAHTSARSLTPTEQSALNVLGNLMPNAPTPFSSPLTPPTPQEATTPTQEARPRQRPQLGLSPPISEPGPSRPPQQLQQPVLVRDPRHPDPIKNVLTTDIVMKQTVLIAGGKLWKDLPNGRIRVRITPPLEDIVRMEIERWVRPLRLALNTVECLIHH